VTGEPVTDDTAHGTAGGAGGVPIAGLLDSIRSKNAGPFSVATDLFFRDRDGYDFVVASRAITQETVAALYNVDPATVLITEFAPALAIKVSIPRLVPGGAPGDTDVAGGQQYAPLLDLVV